MAVRKKDMEDIDILRKATKSEVRMSHDGDHMMFVDRHTRQITYIWIGGDAGQYLEGLFDLVERECGQEHY
jgi:hypothetical protein